jgi:hypothetical protein
MRSGLPSMPTRFYNRRFHEVQIITVFAVETESDAGDVILNPSSTRSMNGFRMKLPCSRCGPRDFENFP